MNEQEVFLLKHLTDPRIAVVVMLPDGRLRVDEYETDRRRRGPAIRVEVEPTPAGGEHDLLGSLVALGYIDEADVLTVHAAWMVGNLDDLTGSQRRIVALVSALHRAADELRFFGA